MRPQGLRSDSAEINDIFICLLVPASLLTDRDYYYANRSCGLRAGYGRCLIIDLRHQHLYSISFKKSIAVLDMGEYTLHRQRSSTVIRVLSDRRSYGFSNAARSAFDKLETKAVDHSFP